MATSMLFKKENVKEIELGMIKHRVDESAPVRKVCFSILQRLVGLKSINFRPFISSLIVGINDEEEEVRYLSLKICKSIWNDERRSLLLEEGERLGKNLELVHKLLFKNVDTVLKERGRAYQCLEFYIFMVTQSNQDVDLCKNLVFPNLLEQINSHKKALEEIFKANEI